MVSPSHGRPRSAVWIPDAGKARRGAVSGLVAGWAGRAMRVLRGDHASALFDQALVSGMSFLTTLLIGRMSSASELGNYAIAASLLVSVITLQDALVAVPYTVARGGTARLESAERAGDALMHWLLLSGLTAIGLLVAAALVPEGKRLHTVLLVLAVVAPMALLRDVIRRYCFAHLLFRQALAVDAAVAVPQIAGLLLLASSGALCAPSAFAVTGASCILACGLWLARERGCFRLRRSRVLPTLRESWSYGQWLLVSQLGLLVQGYAAFWLLGRALGSASTGVYAACLSVAMLANPVIIGVGNTIVPKAVQAFRTGGARSLRREALAGALLMGGAMVPVCVAVWLAGEEALHLLYRGGEFAGHGDVVLVLALSALMSAVGSPAGLALQGIGRPKPVFLADAVAAAVTIALVAALIPVGGVLGAAQGVLLGSLTGSLGRWAAFWSVTRHSHELASGDASLARRSGAREDVSHEHH